MDKFDRKFVDHELESLQRTAAAISLIGLDTSEEMPPHLFARISDNAQDYVRPRETDDRQTARSETYDKSGQPGRWFAWLGWAVAAAACIALAANIFVTPPPQPEIAQSRPAPEPTKVLSPAESREQMLRTAPNMVKAEWALGNVKEIGAISGDVVWSDEMQAGYMRFRGLPPNDPGKETYQLWIFDKTQDKATPIDGGTFNVPADGEVVVPINAKLRAQGPEMFAVTLEKPGGVVVSKREKIAALAKVETRSS